MEEHDNKVDFIAYEYQEKAIDPKMQGLYSDYYKCFGWQLESVEQDKKHSGAEEQMTMTFKRNRKIFNRTELTRLQRQFDSCTVEIQKMEKSKSSIATIKAFIVGLLGTGLMAGAVLSYLSDMVLLSALFFIPAIVCWTVPVFLYRAVYDQKAKEVEPLIEGKYDELFEICQKGTELII